MSPWLPEGMRQRLPARTASSNGRCRIRTYDRLIKSQLAKGHKDNKDSELGQSEETTVVPAYRNSQKTDQNSTGIASPDLADIVAAWPELPDAIRSAILTLVQASRGEWRERPL